MGQREEKEAARAESALAGATPHAGPLRGPILAGGHHALSTRKVSANGNGLAEPEHCRREPPREASRLSGNRIRIGPPRPRFAAGEHLDDLHRLLLAANRKPRAAAEGE